MRKPMIRRSLDLLSVALREHFAERPLERKPEDELVMDGAEQVDAWHRQGEHAGPITPVYHLAARACSRFVPEGGTVVDLGCGTGRFAAYLARMRPDVSVLGIDLSSRMVATGNASLIRQGISHRIRLIEGDMTAFANLLPHRTDLINSLFAIHHLPTLAAVKSCFQQIRAAQEQLGCGFVIFDLARPRHPDTPRLYPKILTPSAPSVFQEDSTKSLRAAFTFEEVHLPFIEIFSGQAVESTCSRIFPFYQAYWGRGRQEVFELPATTKKVRTELLPWRLRLQYWTLHSILRSFPQ